METFWIPDQEFELFYSNEITLDCRGEKEIKGVGDFVISAGDMYFYQLVLDLKREGII